MKKLLLLLCLMLLFPITLQASELPFNDVSESKWYYPIIKEAYEMNIMTGTSQTTFEPNGTMSRGMLATVLYRNAGSPSVSYTNQFKDVPSGKYYSEAVSWCYQQGVITGTSSTTFEPSKNITRQDVCVMLARYASCIYGVNTTSTNDLSVFSDYTTVSNYALNSVKWATANGLITGDQGKINPKGNATRAQCAKMILIAIKTMNSQKTFTNLYLPVGCIDTFTGSNGTLTINGWAFDRDDLASNVIIRIYAGNTLLNTISANNARDDVNKAYGISGKHGFSSKTMVSYKDIQTISVYMVDSMSQNEILLGTKSINFSYIDGSLATKNRKVVVIDAGHGGVDPGCSANGINEKDVTLKYALAVGKYLQSKGITVYFTREGDYELSKSSYTYNGSKLTNDLTARAALPKQYNAALYLSIHIDSASASAHGFSCFYNPKQEDSKEFANMILAHLASVGYTNNRGLLDGTRLRSIRGNTTISAMVELGFIQSSDITYLLNHIDTVSAALGDAVIEKLNKGWINPNQVITPDLANY